MTEPAPSTEDQTRAFAQGGLTVHELYEWLRVQPDPLTDAGAELWRLMLEVDAGEMALEEARQRSAQMLSWFPEVPRPIFRRSEAWREGGS